MMRATGGEGQIHGDYTVRPAGVTETRSYEPGIGLVDSWTDTGSAATSYYHADHLGTTRFMTDPSGSEVDASVYTAFGERVAGTDKRYGYVGAYGYQSTLDAGTPPEELFPYLHLGARYYDPGSGRFLQRDPIGVGGGANVYAYVRDRPTFLIDPSGLRFVDDFVHNVGTGTAIGGAVGGTVGGIAGGIAGAGAGGIFGSVPGAGAGWAAGTAAGAKAGAAGGALVGMFCGAFYTVGELLTPVVDWLYSDDFEEVGNAPAPSFGQGGRFGTGGAGGSWGWGGAGGSW